MAKDVPGARKQTLGATVRASRVACELTLEDAAAEVGVSPSTLSRIETGDVLRPAPETLLRLATLYRADYQQFLQLAGHPSSAAIPPIKPVVAFGDERLTEFELKELRRHLRLIRGEIRSSGRE